MLQKNMTNFMFYLVCRFFLNIHDLLESAAIGLLYCNMMLMFVFLL